MKYVVKTIHEDNTILEGIRIANVAKLMGCSVQWIHALKQDKEVASHEFYKKLKKVLDKY